MKRYTIFSFNHVGVKPYSFCSNIYLYRKTHFSMILSSLTTGAPSAITELSAPIFGILGLIGFAIFAIGGKKDNDGQGTNSSPYLKD